MASPICVYFMHFKQRMHKKEQLPQQLKEFIIILNEFDIRRKLSRLLREMKICLIV
jgi:hypothetical protein